MKVVYVKGKDPEPQPRAARAKPRNLHLDKDYITALVLRHIAKHNLKFKK